jgi:hypothetical protein
MKGARCVAGAAPVSVTFPVFTPSDFLLRPRGHGSFGGMKDRCATSVPAALAVALALILLAASLAPAPARSAESRRLVLGYEVYVGGFHSVSIAYDARLGPGSYDVAVSLDGRGILDWWFAWTMKAFSQGRLADGNVVPVRAGADSTWNGRQRRTRLSYPPDGPPAVDLIPRPEADRREEVGPALRAGARDLAGALFALLSRIGANGRCDGREAVFDGRRRYDLVLSHIGEDRLEASSYSAYAGPALRCGLAIERIAGYPREPRRSGWHSADRATVWIAPVFDGLPPAPVRLELDAGTVTLRAHLAGATLDSGGSVQRLASVP